MIDVNKRQAKINKVEELRAQGYTLEDAVKKVGTSHATYYAHRKEIGTKVVVHDGAVPTVKKKYKKQIQGGKMALLFGTSEQLREFLRGEA